MTVRESFLLDRIKLCDLYSQQGGVAYRDIGDAADIFAVASPDGVIRLQANVYPFRMMVQPFSRVGLEKCKAFVRRWA